MYPMRNTEFEEEDKKLSRAFGAFIAKERKKNKIAQVEVADAVDIAQSYYSEIERGIKTVPFPLAIRICQFLHVNLGEFAAIMENGSELEILKLIYDA